MQDLDDFRGDCLDRHNHLRTQYSAPHLVLNRNLNDSAQAWAEALLNIAILRNSVESSRGKVGESISLRKFSKGNPNMTAPEVIQQWMTDIDEYDFESGEGAAGNFTQMIWCNTKEVGFGKAIGNGKCIVVAHYFPPGNVKGFYKENVLPRSGKKEKRASINPLSKCRKSKTKQIYEKYSDDQGRNYCIQREIIHYINQEGNVTEKVHEIRFEGDQIDLANRKNRTAIQSEEDFQNMLQLLPPNVKEKKIQERKFAMNLMNVQNSCRAKHNAPPLILNQELSDLAKIWAEKVFQADYMSTSHMIYEGSSVGENIACRFSTEGPININVHEVINSWYSEVRAYDYKKEYNNVSGIGNFAQLIWRSTREMGAAKVEGWQSTRYKIIIVAMYFPPGNVLGGFMTNVLPANS